MPRGGLGAADPRGRRAPARIRPARPSTARRTARPPPAFRPSSWPPRSLRTARVRPQRPRRAASGWRTGPCRYGSAGRRAPARSSLKNRRLTSCPSEIRLTGVIPPERPTSSSSTRQPASVGLTTHARVGGRAATAPAGPESSAATAAPPMIDLITQRLLTDTQRKNRAVARNPLGSPLSRMLACRHNNGGGAADGADVDDGRCGGAGAGRVGFGGFGGPGGDPAAHRGGDGRQGAPG